MVWLKKRKHNGRENQNIEEKNNLTQEEIVDVQGGGNVLDLAIGVIIGDSIQF